MSEFRYVLVGGGMTAQAAARGIRSVDGSGAILMLGDEPAAPYARPPLSKGLWTGQQEDSIWLPSVTGMELRSGVRVRAIERPSNRVVLESGESIGYERLLLATGGTPRRLRSAPEGIVYFRTLSDYRRLRSLPVGKHLAVIGGGFIGSEMAASLTTAGYRVTLLFPEDGIGSRLLPPDLSRHLNDHYAQRGVDVRPHQQVAAIVSEGDGFKLQTTEGELRADLVVAGLGTTPNDALGAGAGLAVDDGIVVDEALRTTDPSIFAAGDVARFPSRAQGRLVRVEHEDNANRMGWDAGRSMAGAQVTYVHQPFFLPLGRAGPWRAGVGCLREDGRGTRTHRRAGSAPRRGTSRPYRRMIESPSSPPALEILTGRRHSARVQRERWPVLQLAGRDPIFLTGKKADGFSGCKSIAGRLAVDVPTRPA